MIPFINVRAQREAYKSEFLQVEQQVLDSGCFIGGPTVETLEAELAKYTGSAHAITCGSGTDALTIALLALGLEPGDEVIVPDFTFIAPAECVMRLGGIPIFADIDSETLQISAESIEQRITAKTKGIITVNLFGQCAPYKKIRNIAKSHGLWLIEDSAQAFGATQYGQNACTFGDISITSFYPAKPLGCYGDGGALFTQDESLAQKIRLIANHGSRTRYVHEICGMNSRLDAIQAAVLRVKLRHLDDELKKRQENARKYDEFFNVIQGITPQKIADGNTSSYAQYTLLVEDRPAFLKHLENAGIPYCIHYPQPLHEQPCFKEFVQECGTASNSAANNANTIEVCQKVISLPMCAFTNVDAIVEKLKQ